MIKYMIGIYKITNPNGKIYIGKTKNFEKRKKSYYKLNCKEQRKLYHSLKKYGPENHTFEIIEECLIKQLNEREIYWIKELKSVEKGLNLTYGGDGGNLSKESEKLRRINSMKPILQYDLEGNFIQEFQGASEAIKIIGRGNSNNINDCARGIYISTYGFIWKYKEGNIIYKIIPKISKQGNSNKWTQKQRIKYLNSRKGEKRSKEYSEKISKLKCKPVYQYDIQNNLINIFPSFKSINGSKVIGTKKLGKIINKNEYYKGYRFTYNKIENNV